MRNKRLKTFFSVIASIVFVFSSMTQVSALDNKYTIDDMGMSVKIPKSFTVITRDTMREDEALVAAGIDYDEIMTAFLAANIYLQAFSPDNSIKVTLTMVSDDYSKSVNNYSELTASQRQEVLDAFLADGVYLSGVEKKYGNKVFFELALKTESQDKTIYTSQYNTVINGMNINVTLQKDNDELSTDEIKILSGIAESMSFDKIVLNSGPSFDLWRVILWIAIVVVILSLVTFLYKQYNNAKHRKLQSRKSYKKRNIQDESRLTEYSADVQADEANPDEWLDGNIIADYYDDEEISFDEALGYDDASDYRRRSSTDIENYDINVSKKNPQHGMSYFEDSGDSIDNKPDYFDRYFKEQPKARGKLVRFFSAVGTYIKIAVKHTGFFFINLGRIISKSFKGNQTKNKK